VGPIAGGWLFVQIGPLVWPALAVGSLVATAFGVLAARPRTPAT
jgi:hypothetical protein